MVDVRMREDHIVDLRRIDRKVPVLLERLLAVALIKAAVKKYALPVSLDEMHRTRRRLRRTVECYLHHLPPL